MGFMRMWQHIGMMCKAMGVVAENWEVGGSFFVVGKKPLC